MRAAKNEEIKKWKGKADFLITVANNFIRAIKGIKNIKMMKIGKNKELKQKDKKIKKT